MHRSFRILSAGVLAIALLSACSTTRSFAPGQYSTVDSVVKVGDWVDCTMADGSHRKFKVERIEPGRISGQLGTAAAADITELKVSRFDGKKTTWLIVGAVALGAAAIASAAHDAPALNFGPNGPPANTGK